MKILLLLLTINFAHSKPKNFLEKIPSSWKLSTSKNKNTLNRPALVNLKTKKEALIYREQTSYSFKKFCKRYAGGSKVEMNDSHVCTIFVNNRFTKATQVIYKDESNPKNIWILNFDGALKKDLSSEIITLRDAIKKGLTKTLE